MHAIHVPETADWSTGVHEMLSGLTEPLVLVLLEDYLLSGPVDTERLERLVAYMTARGAACMRLAPVPGAPGAAADFRDAGELPKGMPYRMSLQAAVWRREALFDLLVPGETAWDLEIHGTARTNELDAPFLSVVQGARWPLPYFCTAVVRGTWVWDALAFCRREGVPVDLTRRAAESRRGYLRRRLHRRRREALGPLALLYRRIAFRARRSLRALGRARS